MRITHLITAAIALTPTIASATETVTYSYDAKGRLTQVSHSGSINKNIVATYAFDKADNRTSVNITGASFDEFAQPILVLPLSGLAVIRSQPR